MKQRAPRKHQVNLSARHNSFAIVANTPKMGAETNEDRGDSHTALDDPTVSSSSEKLANFGNSFSSRASCCAILILWHQFRKLVRGVAILAGSREPMRLRGSGGDGEGQGAGTGRASVPDRERVFDCDMVRHRGLERNVQRLAPLLGFSNLMIARPHLHDRGKVCPEFAGPALRGLKWRRFRPRNRSFAASGPQKPAGAAGRGSAHGVLGSDDAEPCGCDASRPFAYSPVR